MTSSMFSVESRIAPEDLVNTQLLVGWPCRGMEYEPFQRFSPVARRTSVRDQTRDREGKTAEAIRRSFRRPITQLKLGVNERRTIPLKTSRNPSATSIGSSRR